MMDASSKVQRNDTWHLHFNEDDLPPKLRNRGKKTSLRKKAYRAKDISVEPSISRGHHHHTTTHFDSIYKTVCIYWEGEIGFKGNMHIAIVTLFFQAGKP